MANNTNYGMSSLNNNTGINNTGLGAYASYNNLDASNNTAVGSNSSFYNTSGCNNTAVGAGSLCNNTTGKLNTAIGSSALEGQLDQSTGDKNVAIGAQALYLNAGDLNTAIGTYAALDITQGSYNTFLGASTTFDDPTKDYDYSTAIGYNAIVDASNQIMMGGLGPNGYPDVVIPGNGYLPNFNVQDVSASQIVTKEYVDYTAQGLAPKAACQCIATAGVTIAPGPIDVSNNPPFTTLYTIDGYLTGVGDRVLINNQGTPDTSANVYNGIYVVTGPSPYTWTRSADMADGADALGAFCFIENGTTYQSTSWVQSTKKGLGQPVVIGTDPLLFVKYSSFYYSIGRGLTTSINGSQTYIDVDLSLNAIDYLDSNPNAVQPGTAPSGSGTLNIGTNGTNKTIIGPSSGNPVQFPSGITGATGSFSNVVINSAPSVPYSLDVSGNVNFQNSLNIGNGPGSGTIASNYSALNLYTIDDNYSSGLNIVAAANSSVSSTASALNIGPIVNSADKSFAIAAGDYAVSKRSYPAQLILDGVNGNLGVQNYNPAYTLDVSGTIRATRDTYLATNPGTSVGIGTITPSSTLDVSGNLNVSGYITSGGVYWNGCYYTNGGSWEVVASSSYSVRPTLTGDSNFIGFSSPDFSYNELVITTPVTLTDAHCIILPNNAYGIYNVSFTLDVSSNATSGNVNFYICQTTSSSTPTYYTITQTNHTNIISGRNTIKVNGLFQYNSTNQARYLFFIVQNNTNGAVTLLLDPSHSNIQINKVA